MVYSCPIHECQKKKTTSMNIRRRENSEPFPIDLIIEILSRLPQKSIARFHCLSKLWSSTLRLPYFTELYITRSSSRPPRLFFSCDKTGELLLFSAPQVQNPSIVTASYQMKFQFHDDNTDQSFSYLRGLICVTKTQPRKAASVMYNPSTRESLELPIVEMTLNLFPIEMRYNYVKSFLGYDPIDKQFKVLLSLTLISYIRADTYQEHYVLTLGMKNQWRNIQCCVPYYDPGKEICIDGGLYYQAKVSKIIRFDVRYEKFSFINVVGEMLCWHSRLTLVNYKGKLGAICSVCFRGVTESFNLWVLVDAEKHEWSKHVYVIPFLWKNVVASLSFVGMIAGTNEIVLAPKYHIYDRFYVLYYDFEKGNIRRVEFQGMDEIKSHSVDIFLDQLEDVKLLQTF